VGKQLSPLKILQGIREKKNIKQGRCFDGGTKEMTFYGKIRGNSRTGSKEISQVMTTGSQKEFGTQSCSNSEINKKRQVKAL